jgi:hypothetical protein
MADDKIVKVVPISPEIGELIQKEFEKVNETLGENQVAQLSEDGFGFVIEERQVEAQKATNEPLTVERPWEPSDGTPGKAAEPQRDRM